MHKGKLRFIFYLIASPDIITQTGLNVAQGATPWSTVFIHSIHLLSVVAYVLGYPLSLRYVMSFDHCGENILLVIITHILKNLHLPISAKLPLNVFIRHYFPEC